MTVFAVDDGFVRTHDEAADVIRYAVPGARVRFWKLPPEVARDSTRAYEIALDRLGAQPVVEQGTYALKAPLKAQTLADRCRAQVDAAMKKVVVA